MAIIIDAPSRHLRLFLRSGIRPLLVKPNQVEFEELLGRRFLSEVAIAKAAQGLARRADIVCVSLADKGAVFATRDAAWIGRVPRIRAHGTVGAGDSMVGAMAARLVHHKLSPARENLGDIFLWGLAAGAATAEAEGTALASAARIRALRKRVRLSRIL